MADRKRRTEADMLAAQETALDQAVYVKTRIESLEEKIAELLAAVPQEARDLVLQGRSHLSRYLP